MLPSNVYDRRGATDIRAEHRSSQVHVGLSYILYVITESETRKAKEHETDTDGSWMKAFQLQLIVQQHH